MAKFEDHILQSKKNLYFLQSINNHSRECWDWQVTVAFYAAVHLINAHLVKILGHSIYSHKDTLSYINSEKQLSPSKLNEQEYLAYRKLYNLSRRSRYLCKDADSAKKGELDIAYLTHSIHLDKAICHLDLLVSYVAKTYNQGFDQTHLDLLEIQKKALLNFNYKSKAA